MTQLGKGRGKRKLKKTRRESGGSRKLTLTEITVTGLAHDYF